MFSTFDPVKNPIGFGASDFIELTIAALLVALALAWRPLIEPYGRRLSLKTRTVHARVGGNARGAPPRSCLPIIQCQRRTFTMSSDTCS